MVKSSRIVKVNQYPIQLFELNSYLQLKKQLLSWYLQNGVETSLYSFMPIISNDGTSKNNSSSIENQSQLNKNLEFLKKENVYVPDRNTINVENLDELLKVIKNFNGCSLKNTAKNLVFADGNPKAKVMLIGEAPGAEEDRTGVPFTGQAGHLLDKMLQAIGQDRTNTYLTNVIFWRPPGNRNPTDEEINCCLPYVRRHIEIINPKILILAGSIASKTLLEIQDKGITQLRGKWQDFNINKKNLKIKAMPIFHPAFLLRQPTRKREAWEDLKIIKKAIDKL